MSYCRFGEDSDVYVYADVGGYLNCCGCSLSDHGFHAFDTDEMIHHLRHHVEVGHVVPSHCFEGLEEDRAENDAWIEAAR